MKYVGLPVKVLPEATFRNQLDEARRRQAEAEAAVAVTHTDSDGRFTVRLPRSGRYVIAIATPTRHRWSPLGTLSYYWQASLDGRPAKRLTLRGETGVEGQAPYLVAYRPPR
ncbi:MAG TPA: hypothetical protein VJ648_01910 [Vicinamibacteria bacterium]|nr:hypothetical protein [Vicinamibacteria bacterium]